MYFVMYGVRTAARMAITATTTTTSIRVNPFSFRSRIAHLLPGSPSVRYVPDSDAVVPLPMNYDKLYIMILN